MIMIMMIMVMMMMMIIIIIIIIIINQNKYQELANEICAIWKQNTAQVIPLVISSTGVIPKSLSQSLKRLNLHPNTSIHSFSSLSDDKSKASSKASSPYSAIQSFLFQMRVSSPFLKVIQ
jgi:hypothetical protein